MSVFFRKISFFAAVSLLGYFAVLFAFAVIELPSGPVGRYFLENPLTAGQNEGQTLTRFRDVRNFSEVDVLFMGSSRAYNGYDTRVFNARGIKTFNLGTTAQTPLNAYFLLQAYSKELKPKSVVLDLYFPLLEIDDGLESAYDIEMNAPLTIETFWMAAATKSPQAVHSFFFELFRRLRAPLSGYVQKAFEGVSYVSGGYCSTKKIMAVEKELPKKDVSLSRVQKAYLRRICDWAKRRNIGLFIVLQPSTETYKASVANYNEVSAELARIAAQGGAFYYDFNDSLRLDPRKDFQDSCHLNDSGAARYSQAVMERFFAA